MTYSTGLNLGVYTFTQTNDILRSNMEKESNTTNNNAQNEQAGNRPEAPNLFEMISGQNITDNLYGPKCRLQRVFSAECIETYAGMYRELIECCDLTETEKTVISAEIVNLKSYNILMERHMANLMFIIHLILDRYFYSDKYLILGSHLLTAYGEMISDMPDIIAKIEEAIVRLVINHRGFNLRITPANVLSQLSEDVNFNTVLTKNAFKSVVNNHDYIISSQSITWTCMNYNSKLTPMQIKTYHEQITDIDNMHHHILRGALWECNKMSDIFLCFERVRSLITEKECYQAACKIRIIRRTNMINWIGYKDYNNVDDLLWHARPNSAIFEEVSYCSSHCIGDAIFHSYQRKIRGKEINYDNFMTHVLNDNTETMSVSLLDFVLRNWETAKHLVSDYGACYLPKGSSGKIRLAYGATLTMLIQAGYVCGNGSQAIYLTPPRCYNSNKIMVANKSQGLMWHVNSETETAYLSGDWDLMAMVAGQGDIDRRIKI